MRRRRRRASAAARARRRVAVFARSAPRAWRRPCAPAGGENAPDRRAHRPGTDDADRDHAASLLAPPGGRRAGRLPYEHAPVAQWTERRTSNPRVGGSNPPGRIELPANRHNLVRRSATRRPRQRLRAVFLSEIGRLCYPNRVRCAGFRFLFRPLCGTTGTKRSVFRAPRLDVGCVPDRAGRQAVRAASGKSGRFVYSTRRALA